MSCPAPPRAQNSSFPPQPPILQAATIFILATKCKVPELLGSVSATLPGAETALYVTEDTIQKHLQNVFEKVGVRSRQALIKRLYLDTIFQ